MWPDRVSNPGPLTNESGALPTALRGPTWSRDTIKQALWCLNAQSGPYACNFLNR